MEDSGILDLLKIKEGDLILYKAGLPHFPRNFARDSIISAVLLKDLKMLKDELIFCSKKQGLVKNFFTGEEFGKIFHEFPGYLMRDLSTEYNACDTTSLFLIGHEYYLRWSKDFSLLKNQIESVKSAVNYIYNHLNNYFFIDDPSFCGANKFSLKVTFWKDSQIIGRSDGEPIYPVCYFLAHVQAMSALRSASFLLNDKSLLKIVGKMKKKISVFITKDNFYSVIDKKGRIGGFNSDFLHALFYLDKNDLTNSQIKKILFASRELETPLGYRVMSPCQSVLCGDSYHSSTVWPFEQAIINIGARKFNLGKIKEVSLRIKSNLKTNTEIFLIKDGLWEKAGCDPQLWTFAARKYFEEFENIYK